MSADVSDPARTVDGMTTTIESDLSAIPLFPTRTCEPWCEEGDAHGDKHPDDRRCYSTSQRVPLSRHKPEAYSDGWHMSQLTTYLTREYRDDQPHIVVHCEESDEEIRLSLTETNLLVQALSGLLLTEASR